ncbi:MAG: ABC transporter ATP-binding protein, partial [Lachnospiraceae bacterium]|nr:ABC transporter ATP-binding protein [Lachnospiraceae bacterium]
LALARALLRKPACLILDDTFSALDQRTIEQIRRSVQQWPGVRLMVIISQKVEHIRRLNNIAVLADGQLQGFGSHDGLLAANELYREICASQESGSAGGSHE